MPRLKKRLVDLVRDGTFLARKDHRLLGDGAAVPWPELEQLRLAYRGAAGDEEERRALALSLERDLREPDAQRRLLGDLQAELSRLGPAGSYRRLERFFPAYFTHLAGPAAGKPFTLEPFQRRFLREAWRRDKRGERLYQVNVWGIPKGNGKTPIVAGLGTFTLVDRVDAPEVYSIAGSSDQAGICHAFASVNIERSALAAWLTVAGDTIYCDEHLGEFVVLSSAGDLGHGTIPSLFIVDEWWLFVHRQQREAYNAGAKALHKRPGEGALVAITTAGYDSASQLGETFLAAMAHPLLEVREKGRGPLYVVRDKESGFHFEWYGAPDDADIENPAVIRKANPLSLVRPDDLLRELHRADTDELDWRRLHLNQWTKTRRAWLSSGVWPGLRSTRQIPEGAGADITVGIDAADSYDTTAVGWAWVAPDGRKVLRAHAWSVRLEAPHHTFVDGGELVNELFVEPFIAELSKHFRIRAIGFDPRYFQAEARHLADAGYTVVKVHPQSAPMADAVTLFEKDALAGKLEHDGDRVLASHIEAIDAISTPRGKKIGKRTRSHPIDAGIAAIVANYLADVAPGLVPAEPFVLRPRRLGDRTEFGLL